MPCLCAASRAAGNLCPEFQSLRDRQRAACEALRECLAGEMLHHEVGRAVVGADVIQACRCAVRERGDGRGLPSRSAYDGRIGAQFGGRI